MAVGVKNVDESEPIASDVVRLGVVLLGIGDVQIATYVLNTEGGKALGNMWIVEIAGQVSGLKSIVEHVDLAAAEIRRIKEIAGAVGGKRKPLIDGIGCCQCLDRVR